MHASSQGASGRVGEPHNRRFLVVAPTQVSAVGRIEGGVAAGGRRQHNAELHDLAIDIGVGGSSAGEGEDGGVDQGEGASGQASKVDDDIGALAGGDEQ